MPVEAKHTPGPWDVVYVGDDVKKYVVGHEGISLLAVAEEGGISFAAVYSEADAHLIAAAPEIAICLEAMLKITCGTCEGGDDRCITPDGFDACLLARQAKAALAKAKGE